MKTLRHRVPFHSQHAEEFPLEWRRRSCGIAAVKMALAAHQVERTGSELLQDALSHGAYLDQIGWKHQGLVELVVRNGRSAYRRDFFSDVRVRRHRILGPLMESLCTTLGMRALVRALRRHETPIVSIRYEGMEDSHLVPVTGYEKRNGQWGFLYNDSACMDRASGEDIFVEAKRFRRLWRRLALFVK